MATKKIIEVVTDDKEFSKVIADIKVHADSFARLIHIAGIYALMYANVHGDITKASQLVESLGKKHDKKRVQQWLVHFGKIAFKDGVTIYRKRKDILPENVEAWAFRANETPYWELNAQAQLKMTFDYLTMVNGIINIHNKKVAELTKAGKQVSEVNVALIDQLKTLIKGYTPKVEVK